MKKNLNNALSLLMVSAMIICSCKKHHDPKPGATENKDNTQEYLAFNNDFNTVDEDVSDAQEKDENARTASFCFDIKWELSTQNPAPGFGKDYKKFTLTYGAGTCDSLERSGSITVYQSGDFLHGDYKDSIIFNNYTTNGRSLTGYKTYKLSAIDLLNVVGTYEISIQSVSSNGRVNLFSEGQRRYVNYLTKLLSYVEITGFSQIITGNGGNVKLAITKPLVLKKACMRKMRFPVEGTINYINTIKNTTSTIDYGTGNCDRVATITTDNNAPVTFILK
jgi:hypothetical protein